MKNIRSTILLLAIAAVSSRGSAFAQTAAAPARPQLPAPVGAFVPNKAITVSGENDPTIWLKGSGFVSVSVYVTNHTTGPLTITGVGTNPVFFSPVPPTTVLPGERKSIDVTINMDGASFPVSGPIFFQVADGSGAPAKAILATAKFSSRDVVMLDARFVRWSVGDPTLTKTVNITNVPAGVKITGAKVLNPAAGFDVSVDGDIVSITPKSTAAMMTSPVELELSPSATRPVTVMALVLQPQPVASITSSRPPVAQ